MAAPRWPCRRYRSPSRGPNRRTPIEARPISAPIGAQIGRGLGGTRVEHVYGELHCHTHSSFLDGVSAPDALVARAAELGYTALAVTDHNGFPAAVRVAQAAEDIGLPIVYGSELTLRDS